MGLEPSAAGPAVGLGFRLGSGGFGWLPGAENRGSGAKKLVFELISIFSEAPGHFPSRNTPSGSTPTALRAVPRWAPGTLRQSGSRLPQAILGWAASGNRVYLLK